MASVIIPKNSSERINVAKNELLEFYFKATGETLSVYTEDNAPANSAEIVFVLGNCESLLSKAGVKVDFAKLGLNGFIIKTVNNTVYIVGGQQYGTLNGVYEFLRICFGFEAFSTDCVKINQAKNFKIPNIDLVKVPDIQQMMSNYGVLYYNPDKAIRLGFEKWSDIWIYVKGHEPWHNFLVYVDPKIYNNKKDHPECYHPDWFTKNGICLSKPGVFDIILEQLKVELEKNPTISNVTITQQDHAVWCECDECKKDLLKYGSNSGNMVKFMNKISRAITPWLKEKFPGRIVNFAFFAYQKYSRKPPVYLDNNGEYQPIDKDVICEDNVAVFLCTDNALPYKDNYQPCNKEVYDTCIGWRAVCKKMFLWAYETNYLEYLPPFDTIDAFQQNFRFYRDINTEILFSLGEYHNANSSGFSVLKMYLQSKLRWNVDCDLEAETLRFFDNYFEIASKPMYEYYKKLSVHFRWQDKLLKFKPCIYLWRKCSPKYWPLEALKSMKNSILDAFKIIETIKTTEPERYETLHNRISLELIAIDYLILRLYVPQLSKDEAHKIRVDIRSACKANNVTEWWEGIPIHYLYRDWRDKIYHDWYLEEDVEYRKKKKS